MIKGVRRGKNGEKINEQSQKCFALPIADSTKPYQVIMVKCVVTKIVNMSKKWQTERERKIRK